MNLLPPAALQAQMNAAQQQALQAQIQLAQQQREMAAASSPASMQGTPIMHNETNLPGARGGTPARVGSLQAGRSGVRPSPNVNHASTVSFSLLVPCQSARLADTPIIQVPMPNQANNGMTKQQQLQQELRMAQIQNNARAQLQATYQSQNQIQNQNPNLNQIADQANLVANMQRQQGGMPPGVHGNLPPGVQHPGQIAPNGAHYAPQPVVDITPTDIRSLIIPDILTETAWSAPKPARFLDYVRPSRLSLSNGLGANHSMAMPVYSARPPALEQLSASLKIKTGRTAALKGTLFDKAFSGDPEDEKEEQRAEERAAIERAEEEEQHQSEVGKRSPGQMSVDEVEEETTIHPRVKRRKLCDVAKLAKRDLTITEGSEEVSSLMSSSTTYKEANHALILSSCYSCVTSSSNLRWRPAAVWQSTARATSWRSKTCSFFSVSHRRIGIDPVHIAKVDRVTLAHNYDVQLPGYASDAIRIEQNKADLKAIASAIPSTRASRLNAVQQAKSGAKVKG